MSVIIGSGIFFQHCTDPISTGDYIKKTQLEKETAFEADSAKWSFSELYSPNATFSWKNKYINNKFKATLDTANGKTVISLELDVESSLPDINFSPRQDRILKFKLKLDSVLVPGQYDLSGNSQSGRWCNITVKDMSRTGMTYSLESRDLLAHIFINSIKNNTTSSNIGGMVSVSFPPQYDFDTKGFIAIFDIYYKKYDSYLLGDS